MVVIEGRLTFVSLDESLQDCNTLKSRFYSVLSGFISGLIEPEYIWSRLHQARETHSLDSIYSAFLWGRYSRLLFGQAMRWNHVSISFGMQWISAKPHCGGTQSPFMKDSSYKHMNVIA